MIRNLSRLFSRQPRPGRAELACAQPVALRTVALKTFLYRIDDVRLPAMVDSEHPWRVGRAFVQLTMLDGFEAPPVLKPQMRVAIGDGEQNPIYDLAYRTETRIGSYWRQGPSRFVAGQNVTGVIRTQLHPADTHAEILRQLRVNPAGLMIEMFGRATCGWIAPDDRAAGRRINIGGHDESTEYIPSLKLVADLLRGGDLELDGDGVVKLAGSAFVPVAGAWWGDGVVGKDCTVADVIDQIERQGSGEVPERPKYDSAAAKSMLEKFEKWLPVWLHQPGVNHDR